MKPVTSKKEKIKRILHKIFLGDTAPKKIFLFYIYTIILGVILLSLPFSLNHSNTYEKVVNVVDGQEVKQSYGFLDILFTTISAFSDSGLVTCVTANTFSWFGQLVILLLIQIGGLGLFTIYWCFWNLIFNNRFYKKRHNLDVKAPLTMSFSQNFLIYAEKGNTKLGLTTKTIKPAILFILSVQLFFWVVYSIYFAVTPAYQPTQIGSLVPGGTNQVLNSMYVTEPNAQLVDYYHSAKSIWIGLFHSISSINNAGFDIIGPSSLVPYRNGAGTILQIFTIMQIVIGGLGYPIIYDVITKIYYKKLGKKFNLSIFTKLCLITYAVIFAVGMILIFSFELSLSTGLYKTLKNSPIEYQPFTDAYFGTGPSRNWNIFSNLLFEVTTSRSAGFSTISQSSLSIPSRWTVMFLMFIGCSPSSNGGGIKTITLAIIVMLFISKIRGAKQTLAFKRAIPKDTIIEAFLVLTLGFLVVLFLSLIFFGFWDKSIGITDMLFEWTSAFSTTGLSIGVISKVLEHPNVASSFFILFMCLIMIIGQLGLSNTISAFNKNISKQNSIVYPEETLKI